jgi:hypothetical protein
MVPSRRWCVAARPYDIRRGLSEPAGSAVDTRLSVVDNRMTYVMQMLTIDYQIGCVSLLLDRVL